MKDITLGDGENSTVVIRDRYGQVIAVFIERGPGITKEYSLAVDSLVKPEQRELGKVISQLGIINEFK